MDRDTFTDSITAFKRRTPFRPFTILTLAGSRHEVDHLEAIIVRGGTALFLAPGNIPVIFDHEGVSEVIGDLAGNPSGA